MVDLFAMSLETKHEIKRFLVEVSGATAMVKMPQLLVQRSLFLGMQADATVASQLFYDLFPRNL